MQLNKSFWIKAYFVVLGCIFAVTGNAWSQDADMTDESLTAVTEVATQAQPRRFDLLELRVKGNTKLDRKQLERTIYPFLGLKKSIDNVEAARAALEQLYRTNGFQTVAVDIPEQDVKNGVVYLQVVEGKISRLRVKDSRYFDQGKIRAAVPELAEGSVPNFPKMQKQLAELSNQSSDRKVVPVLRAGETPGTLEVDLKVQDELPMHGRVELNGRNTQGTERLRLVNFLRYDNLWQRMHSASLMYQVSPEDSNQVSVWAGTYALPILDDGSRLSVYGVGTSSNVPAVVGANNIIGNGHIFGARFIKALSSQSNFYHNATFGVDYKDFKQDIKHEGVALDSSPITYLPFLVQYGGAVNGESFLTSFELGLHFSIRGLGNDQKEFECVKPNPDDCLIDKNVPDIYYGKRRGAKANYAYLSGNIKHKQQLPWDMELFARISGQFADTPLINNEQFSLGGSQSVRGYFETQALVDDALFGSLELHSPHLAPTEWDEINELKLLAFFDAGQGWMKDSLPGNVKSNFLSGGGFGLRFKVLRHLSGLLDLGIPFTSLGTVQRGDPRLHFSIASEF
jgi:hemolysin activation/secretion protein